MKIILVGIFCINLFAFAATAQNTTDTASTPSNESAFQILETSCGQCNFNLPGKGCDLAVRIRGKAYFVDGTNIDDHGDAHASDGFCTAIRKAHIQGKIVDNRFKTQYFKLIPLAEEKKDTK